MENEMEHITIETNEERTIIIVGKTGAGKSKLLNELLRENDEEVIFDSSANTESCTDKVEASEFKKVKFEIEKEYKEIFFQLKAFDTPGIADSKGRSKEFLNQIASTIKKTPLNLIIILVEYGRLDTGLFNNLEVLRECLNDLSQSSSMLIISKVPTEKSLAKKRKNKEKVTDRNLILEQAFAKLSEALGNKFKFEIFLENDADSEEAENFNSKQCDYIRQIIFSCSSKMIATKVRTWNEIVEFYERETAGLSEKEVDEQMNNLIAEIKDKIDKVEFDIADINYPFLEYMKCLNEEKSLDTIVFSSLLNIKSVVLDFECQITEKSYNERKMASSYYNKIASTLRNKITPSNIIETASKIVSPGFNLGVVNLGLLAVFGAITVGFAASMYYFYQNNKNIDEKLNYLGKRRDELKKKLEKCQGSVDEQKKILEEKKNKIKNLVSRLESSLENPNQIQVQS